MILDSVYVRFFRSLNFDYLRKAHPGYQPDPWDEAQGDTFPFVRIRLNPEITTIVGANESGKSQLLAAIRFGLSGENIDRGDFCRYSPFFAKDAGLTLPEFGLRFPVGTQAEYDVIAEMCELDERPTATAAAFFRMNQTPKTRLYLLDGGAWTMHHVKKPTMLKELGLPAVFQMEADVPLPNAVPLEYLAKGKLSSDTGREGLRRGFKNLLGSADNWFSSPDSLRSSADEVMAAMAEGNEPGEDVLETFKLGRDLLIEVAGLDVGIFSELQKAVAEERSGYANSLVDKINEELAKSLNFPHWWSQDSAFRLVVDLREDELVFVIHDRTGTSYSFDERSAGLKYFLSYFVQYLAHKAPADGQPEILLMDEPDAFLSSSGQQDLLRIFSAFARPDDSKSKPIQVVYVTHSPFLIDKNHAERIRVLEKGEHDEGTRVVTNASKNHYEPLRSSLGGFVGETTFIGSCNLLLEGASDQILVAGMASRLVRQEGVSSQRLDLNTITLVPAGSASHVPYMAFVARGRDVERPPVIVLLDGDGDGDLARKALEKGGPRGKQVIAPEYVLQLSDKELDGIKSANPAGRSSIEDLIPLEVALDAVKRYCAEFAPERDLESFAPDASTVYAESRDTHAGLEAALQSHLGDEEFHLDKIGFARSVLASIEEEGSGADSVATFEGNFYLLLAELAKRQRKANREASSERIQSRVHRARERFLVRHQSEARKEDVTLLIEEIEGQLDSSPEAEDVRSAMRGLVSEYTLEEEPRSQVPDYPQFLNDLESLPYVGTQAVQVEDSQ